MKIMLISVLLAVTHQPILNGVFTFSYTKFESEIVRDIFVIINTSSLISQRQVPISFFPGYTNSFTIRGDSINSMNNCVEGSCTPKFQSILEIAII